mmetsp:Transcript_3966/g.4049  ORF Transcript_3966/g.4049 Transcript_3966/m.4049 type:complete len:202 (-) Transcript_3966:6-611(-)
MNFVDCLDILKKRNADSSVDSATNCLCANLHKVKIDRKLDVKSLECNISEDLIEMSNLDMVNLLTLLQSERVETFIEYESIFQRIIQGPFGMLSEYPFLCAEVTSRFSVISSKIRDIKINLYERKLITLHKAVEQLQELEKEKLSIIAAIHMDSIQEKYNLFQQNQVCVISTSDYNQSKIKELEEKIRHIMEDIQAEKCDL